MERVLNCKCGNRILVTNAQAGRQVICSACAAEVSVPTLRGLSELPFAEVSEGKLSNKRGILATEESEHDAWRWRGPAMAVCLVALVGSAYYAFNALSIWYQIDTSVNVEKHLEAVAGVLESAGPDQLSQMWDEYSEISLQRPPAPPDYKLYSDFAAQKLRNGQIGSGIALVMLVSLIVLWKSAAWARQSQRH